MLIPDAIIGGIIGSVITILLSKVLDMIQKSKEHKYNLSTIYFEKKLNALEALASKYYRINVALRGMSVMLEKIEEYSGLIDTIWGTYAKDIGKL